MYWKRPGQAGDQRRFEKDAFLKPLTKEKTYHLLSSLYDSIGIAANEIAHCKYLIEEKLQDSNFMKLLEESVEKVKLKKEKRLIGRDGIWELYCDACEKSAGVR